ncbi:MAG TPA: choice-of-anchor D domain-containing protein [Chitinophagales bacterium]|nr:choice-of-anchor D domain-containing protein [Chitinophagales bacterium]
MALICFAKPVFAQLFQQDFSSSTTYTDYVNASPNSGQWNAIGTSGAGTVISINTTTSNKLRYARTGNAGSYSRTSDFSGPPSSLLYRLDLAISGNSAAQTTAAVFQVGSGFGTANSAEANANVHSRFGVNWTATTGQFSLRDIGGGSNSSNFSGTQTVFWAINNSGGSLTYKAPDGTNESIANDTWDLWIGNSKAFNDISATTSTQTLPDLKFAFTAGTGTIDIDNILIDPIPPTPTANAASSIANTSFTANWTTVSGVTGYRLDVATDNGFTSFVSGYNNLYVPGQSTASQSVTGLTAGTTYYYRVRSASQYTVGEFASGNSGTITATTTTSGPQEIDVESPTGTAIANGGSRTSFGSFQWGTNNDFTFRVKNTGGTDLSVSSISFGGTNSGDFSLVSAPTFPVTITPSSQQDFTVRFSPGGTGSRTGTITFNNDDSDEGTYVINISGTGTANTSSDIEDNTAPYSSSSPEYNINSQYISFTDATSTTAGKVIPMKIRIRDGGSALSDADNVGTELTDLKLTVKNTSGTNRLNFVKTAILTTIGGTVIATASQAGSELVFSGMSGSNVTATDNSDKILHLRISFNEANVTDNEKLVFKISSATASSSGSTFAATDAGGAETDNSTGNDRNRIEVVTDRLGFIQQPTNTSANSAMSPAPTVEAKDANGRRDLDYTTTISITSSGILNTSPLNATPSSGLATFSSVIHTAQGTGLTLTATSGALTSATSSTFDITLTSSATDYFRSAATGNWGSTSTWESSPDNSIWISATLVPNQNANTITIRNGHIVTIAASVTADQVVINNGGTLQYSGDGSVDFTLNDGTGTDLIIENGGRMLLNNTVQALYYEDGTVVVKSGGMIEVIDVGSNGEADGYANNEWQNNNAVPYEDLITWEDGAIFYWNTTQFFSTSNPFGIDYFPGNQSNSNVAIFRFNGNSGNHGGSNDTRFFGVVEISAGKTLNFTGTGVKVFKNGIRGSGNIAQNSTTCGQFQITGNAELGGSGTITLLNTTSGMLISSASTTTLSANKTISSGPINVAGTFDLTDKSISGTYTAFNVSGSSYVKTAHANGLRSSSGSLQNNSATYDFGISGTTVEYNKIGAQTVTNHNYYNLTLRGAGNKTLAGNITVFGNLEWIDLNGTAILKCGANTLDVRGNWDSNSSAEFDYGTGSVNFGQTGNTRSISGSNNFNILKIFGTVNLSSGTQNVYGRIEVPTAAVLNTNGNLTLQSGASLIHGTGTTNGGGTVNGTITVKRTGHSGNKYNYWSTPVATADVSILGANLYFYEPANATDNVTLSGLRAGWVPASGNMTLGKGYISQSGGTVSFSGTSNNGNISINITKNVGTSNNVPWNLIGNPYPCGLDASLFIGVNGPSSGGGNNTITGSLYFWDDDGSGGSGYTSGDYAVWNLSGSVPGPNSGMSPNGFVASGQSFFVEKISDGTSPVSFTNAMRASANNVFFRQSPISRFWMRITAPGNQNNETLIAFMDAATDSLDLLFDGRKLNVNNDIALYTKINDESFSIQAFPQLQHDRIIPLWMDAGTEGRHLLKLSWLENFDETVTIILEDRQLNHFQNLNKHPEYEFYTPAAVNISRFFLHLNPAMLIAASEESCGGNDGEISLFQPGNKLWNYVLYDCNQQFIASGMLSGSISFTGLKSGIYTLELTDQSAYSVTKKITVEGKHKVNADFIPTYSIAPADQFIHFVNNSTGANFYEWDFGDGTTVSGINDPFHAYSEEGNYLVTLRASNNDCEDVSSHHIAVYNIASGMGAVSDGKIHVSSRGNLIRVHFGSLSEKNVLIHVHNGSGQKIYQSGTNTRNNLLIDLTDIAGGIYFLTIRMEGITSTYKVLLGVK